MASTQTKQKQNQFYDKNSIEAIRDVSTGVAKSVAHDLGDALVSDLWDQLLGNKPTQNKKGDLSQGQELDLSKFSKKGEQARKADVDPGIDYRREILHTETKIRQENQQELQVQIQEILIELKKLISSSSELQVQYRQLTTDQRIVKVGKYHLNFFTFLLKTIQSARLKVENSAAWLSSFKSKKAQKGYWNQFKKHGTSFGLSNERVVATQTG